MCVWVLKAESGWDLIAPVNYMGQSLIIVFNSKPVVNLFPPCLVVRQSIKPTEDTRRKFRIEIYERKVKIYGLRCSKVAIPNLKLQELKQLYSLEYDTDYICMIHSTNC